MSRSEIWARIRQLQLRGEAAEARQLLEQARPELTAAEIAELRGDQLFSERRFQDAIYEYEKAIRVDPEHVIARYQYLVGEELWREKNYVEAFDRFVAAIESEPDFVDPYVELGAMLMAVGDAKGALKCFEDALALEPDELGNYRNVVTVLDVLVKVDRATYESRHREAVQQFREASQRLPEIPRNHIHDLPLG
jgi:tetratricopeptide (TPR) repeat protein